MENFFSLRAERQEHIINAALTVFGKNGYKKASVADIAAQAKITKGMITYYFGSKKNLYLYLADYGGKIMIEELERGIDPKVTDFFEKIKMMSDIKVALIKRNPAISAFMASVYYEADPEVAAEVAEFRKVGMEKRQRMVIGETDVSRFKADIDPELLDKLMVWAGEGFGIALMKPGGEALIDSYIADFYQVLDVMKKYFYEETLVNSASAELAH